MHTHFLALPILLLSLACSSGGDSAPSASTDLDKATAIKQLETFQRLADEKKYEEIIPLMGSPAAKEAELKEKIATIIPKMLEIKEISAGGIKILSEKGTFGSLSEVFPERGERWAKRVDAKVEDCKALKGPGEVGEVVFCKLGGSWKIIRLNNVGKLE